jgi:hypothetical protein
VGEDLSARRSASRQPRLGKMSGVRQAPFSNVLLDLLS